MSSRSEGKREGVPDGICPGGRVYISPRTLAVGRVAELLCLPFTVSLFGQRNGGSRLSHVQRTPHVPPCNCVCDRVAHCCRRAPRPSGNCRSLLLRLRLVLLDHFGG
ncbi:GPI-anchored surface protein, putative, partial [Bodo saltans]